MVQYFFFDVSHITVLIRWLSHYVILICEYQALSYNNSLVNLNQGPVT